MSEHLVSLGTPNLGQCEHVMQQPPKRPIGGRRLLAEWRHHRKPGWSQPCPRQATMVHDGKRYCSAHAPLRKEA